METSQNLLSNDLQVDSRIADHLKEAAGWAKFLGILTFIGSALMAVFAFAFPYYLTHRYSDYGYPSYQSNKQNTASVMITVVYLIFAVIIFFAGLFTMQFGSKTKSAILMNDQESLEKGMRNLKFLYRYHGILAIISIGLFIITLISWINKAGY